VISHHLNHVYEPCEKFNVFLLTMKFFMVLTISDFEILKKNHFEIKGDKHRELVQ
jgi:hypothetical protein